MGFGRRDVMSMIGAFVGWQAAVMIFFAAPATALVFGSIKWLITRDNAFCYGPFLCLAAVGIVAGGREFGTGPSRGSRLRTAC